MGIRRAFVASWLLAAAACGGDAPAIDAPEPPDDGPVDAPGIDAPDWWPPETCGGGFPAITLERVGTASFPSGTHLASSPGDRERLYVVSQTGVVDLLRDGARVTPPFLDLSASTEPSGENGGFAIAFHRDYATSGRFWISRTPSDDGVVTVEEFRRSAADPDRADPTPVRTLARSVAGDGGTHNGGALAFGPDGALYWSVGDGRSGSSQDPGFLRGKLFRLDVDAPGTEPVDLAAATWARGLRNPWRFSFDRATGDLYIGDVGGSTEELNLALAGTPAGRDYGWPTVDGSQCAMAGCDLTGVTFPIARANAGVVVGGHVYRGLAIPCLRGWYVYTDFSAGIFSRLRLDDGGVADHAEIAGLNPHPMVDQPTSMGEDADGELYVVNRNTGGVFRIVAAP